MDKLTRRQIRYICFRLQTEANGDAKAKPEKEGPMQHVDEIKEHMESQEDFDGWKNFGKTWDVGDKAPLVVVTRMKSIQSEWNKILKEEAKELPVTKAAEQEAEHLRAAGIASGDARPGGEASAVHLEGEEEKKIINKLQEQVEKKKEGSKKTSFWDKLK